MNGGIYEQIKNGNTITIQGGQLTILELTKAMGITLTKEEQNRYNTLTEQWKESERIRKEKFLIKWGENTIKLHEWLTEKFGNPFTRNLEQDYKSWRISSWLDNCDQSEGIQLDWEYGSYYLRFNQEDGYGKNVIIKEFPNEDYIYNCIENWK